MSVHWHDDEFRWCPCDEPEGTCGKCWGTGQVAVTVPDADAPPGVAMSITALRLAECPGCDGTGNTTTP